MDPEEQRKARADKFYKRRAAKEAACKVQMKSLRKRIEYIALLLCLYPKAYYLKHVIKCKISLVKII